MTKKITKKIIFILVLMVFGGLGGVIADRYFFPYLSTTKIFSRYEFLKKGSENITIINKTEQVTVREETSISRITSKISSSIVNIVSYPDKEAGAGNLSSGNASKTGAGVIVTSDGMIMTYATAINTLGSKHKVVTYDGNTYEAELLGVDSYSNLAFLKIEANNLPAISFADSEGIKSGEKIIAVSNSAEAYTNRYASGLISNINSSYNLAGLALSSSEKLEGVYEADLDYNNYLVGSPVVDYSGQAAGIIGAIEKNNVQSFFVIPSNKVKIIIERAIRKELEENPILGIYYIPISKNYMLENGLAVSAGALIYSVSGQQGLAVLSNSPAQKADLKLGDIITTVGGKEVGPNNSLPDLLYAYKKGDQVELGVLRDEDLMMIEVSL